MWATASASATAPDIANLSVGQILVRSEAALNSASSLRVNGSVISGGQKETFDVRFAPDGASGAIGVGPAAIHRAHPGQVDQVADD